MKVLIVEDDPEIAMAIREGLEDSSYVVEIIRDGERALKAALTKTYSVIILDLMLPSLNGLEICRQLRAARNMTPILMLTAMGTLNDRVSGLESGADDYLTKPFEFDELLARVRALIRRDKVIRSAQIVVDDLIIDTSARTVTRAGKDINLTRREYTLLEGLASRIGQVVTRETILHVIWVDEFSTSNTVDVHVRNLRKKIDEGFDRKLIQTIFGSGYMLRVEEAATTYDSN